MKLEHEGTVYIDAADHAGLRCWIAEEEVEAIEDMRAKYSPDSWARPEPVGDWAKDELINYLADPDAGYARASRIGGVLITDAEDHRVHWPLRNTHRHPLADQPCTTKPVVDHEPPEVSHEHTGKGTSGKTVELGEWPKCFHEEGHGVIIMPAPRVATLYRFSGGTHQYKNSPTPEWFLCFDNVDALSADEAARLLTKAHPEMAAHIREHGHEEAAAEINDRYEPVGTMPVVGDLVCYPWAGSVRAREVVAVAAVNVDHIDGDTECADATFIEGGDFKLPNDDEDACRILKRKPTPEARA